MAEILAPISEKQRNPIDEARVERIGARLRAQGFERTPREVRSRRIRVAAFVAAGCCLLLGGVSLFSPAGSRDVDGVEGPLLLADGRLPTLLEADDGGGVPLLLSDGSSLDLADDAVLRIVENDGQSFMLSLERGRVTFDVAPNGPRRWVVDAAMARVTVVGTRFVVSRFVGVVEVEVERGEVLVEGTLVEDGRRLLARGQRLRIVEEALTERQTGDNGGRASKTTRTEASALERETDPALGWRPLARRGDFDEAFELLGSEGVARETRGARVIDDLFLLADVARRSGHPGEAVAPLEQIVIGHPTDCRAPVAAFTLGRLNMNVLGNPGRARWAFERAIALGAPPALEEDAYALLVEASARSGDRASARSAGREYLRRYPDGRLASSVRAWSGLAE